MSTKNQFDTEDDEYLESIQRRQKRGKVRYDRPDTKSYESAPKKTNTNKPKQRWDSKHED